MKPIRFALLWLLFGSTLLWAQSNAIPYVHQPLVPMSTSPGGGDFILTINGSGFATGATVNWNGTSLVPNFLKSTQLTVTVPASLIATAGTASVTVVNPAPGGGTSNIQFFDITVPSTSVGFSEFEQKSFGTGMTPSIVATPVIADFNNDGKQDMAFVALGTSNYTVCIELGNGDASFQGPTCLPTSIPVTAQQGNFLVSMIAKDFNGDGNVDIALCNGFDVANTTVTIFLGNGDGTLQSGRSSSAGPNAAMTMAAGDFNNDGKIDLAVIDFSADLSILLGNGDGTFQSPQSQSLGLIYEGAMPLVVGDFNKDGKLDLAFAAPNPPGLGPTFVLLGNGDGTFQVNKIVPFTFESLVMTAAADVNGDGNLDLVMFDTYTDQVNVYDSLLWSYGNGDGTFGPTGGGIGTNFVGFSGALMADVNGDGIPDLVFEGSTANPFVNEIGILYATGGGLFQPADYYPSTLGDGTAIWLGLADFNGDGKVDAMLANYTSPNNPFSPVVFQFFIQGDFPAVSLSASSLTFPAQPLGVTSTAQIITLTNTGLATLNLSSITIDGTNASDFAESNTCGSSVAINASCQIAVKFTPMAAGTRTAVLTFADNGVGGGTQSVTLTGTTLPSPLVQFSPTSINFPSQYVGTSGLPQSVTITNGGDAALTIASVATSPADFGSLNACGSTVAPGSSCAVGVFFDPTETGTRTGTLTITDNAGGSPQSVTLSGSGEDFAIAPSGSSTVTVNPGQTANYTLSIAPAGGFNQTVALSCSGAPPGSSCSFSPSSVTLNGSTPTSVSVAVTTAAKAAKNASPLWFAFLGLPALLLLGNSKRSSQKNLVRSCGTRLLFGLLLMVMTWAACGGNSNSGTGSTGTSTTYNLTVTGNFTSGSTNLTHNTKLTLVVQ